MIHFLRPSFYSKVLALLTGMTETLKVEVREDVPSYRLVNEPKCLKFVTIQAFAV